MYDLDSIEFRTAPRHPTPAPPVRHRRVVVLALVGFTVSAVVAILAQEWPAGLSLALAALVCLDLRWELGHPG